MEELLQEVLHEITNKPEVFIAEIIQFALLLGIILWLLPRVLGKKLAERQQKVVSEIREAEQIEQEYLQRKREAEEILANAEKEARQILLDAERNAEKERKIALSQIEKEVEEILSRAQQLVEAEEMKVMEETSEQLAGLVAEAIRRYVDEILSETERRSLTERIILSSLEEMGGTAKL